MTARPLQSGWLRPVATGLGLLLVYYAIPEGGTSEVAFAVGVLTMVVGSVALAWAITGQIRLELSGGDPADPVARLRTLVMLFALTVFVFAYGIFRLDHASPGQVVGLETRTDALYFTLSTMATVGYGDIHAEGQAARALVTLQMTFNIVFLGALASTVARTVRRRAGRTEDRSASEE